MNPYFYNTVGLQGVQLQVQEQSAEAQEKEILTLFKRYAQYSFRAYDIEQLLKGQLSNINHDSTKRAITNLTSKGKLIRSKKAETPGPYHLPVNVWQFNPEGQ